MPADMQPMTQAVGEDIELDGLVQTDVSVPDCGHAGGDRATPDRLSCSSTTGNYRPNPTDIVTLI
jgi:hypothetical protein